MSELPKGWECVKLETVVDKIVGGGTPSKSQPSYFMGDIPWMTVKDMNKSFLTDTVDHITQEAVENSSTNIILAGTPIVATRMSLGKIIRASFDSAINQDLKALFINQEVNQYYFEHWYRSQGMKIESLGTGTTVKGIRLEVLKDLDFPLAPLAEQKRIVEKLDQVLAQVDTIKARLDGIPAIFKRFRQSVLAAAVSGKLTEEWRWENKPAQVSFNEIKLIKENLIKNKAAKKDLEAKEGRLLHSMPKEWLCVKLCSVALKITDGEHKTPKREGTGNYLLSARNVRDGYIALDNVDYVGDEEFSKLRKRCDPNKGDILISCSGSVGRVCLVDEDDKYVMVRSAALVRGIDEIIFNKFMMLALQSPMLQKNIEDSSRSTAQSNLFLGPIKELDFPLPSLKEQTEIVCLVNQYFAFADTIEKQVQKAQQRVDKLTQSILAKAFRGELVPQDPDDEPADELLKRIAAARAESEALAKAAKKIGKKK